MKKLNSVLSVMTAILVTSIAATCILRIQSASGAISQLGADVTSSSRLIGGTIAVSASNVYAAWWNNKTGDFEVMFRASTDNGHTFGPKINLSNSPGVASTDAQIAAEGKNVYVIWWERSGNTAEPFLRISYDNGKTFGEKIMLSNATASPVTTLNAK
jgi:hypothetical protein